MGCARGRRVDSVRPRGVGSGTHCLIRTEAICSDQAGKRASGPWLGGIYMVAHMQPMELSMKPWYCKIGSAVLAVCPSLEAAMQFANEYFIACRKIPCITNAPQRGKEK